jgi:16S rRNA (uracil1498-N3)-methyltransferase
VERTDRAPVSTFHAPGAWGAVVELDEAAAHHASVKRLASGDAVRLTSGDGRRARATITELAKRRLVVQLDADSVEQVPAPPVVELWAPVGDRERMLWLAEKSAELGVSRWRPVVYRRSRSVTPRGEGEAFRDKVRLRMISALEQSGGAWLPEQFAETTLEAALEAGADTAGILLDPTGQPLRAVLSRLMSHDSRLTFENPRLTSHESPFTCRLAFGPEGGLDPDERDAFLAAGWRLARLGPNVLRFETAGLAALAIVRALHE